MILEHSEKRKIVFSCFHPDICTMLRLKQNKYPVMFLTQGVTDMWLPYEDQRTSTVQQAILYAVNSDILGINVHTEDIMRDPGQVRPAQDKGLVVFCWGDHNNDQHNIKFLKKVGLHGIIYDKGPQYAAPRPFRAARQILSFWSSLGGRPSFRTCVTTSFFPTRCTYFSVLASVQPASTEKYSHVVGDSRREFAGCFADVRGHTPELKLFPAPFDADPECAPLTSGSSSLGSGVPTSCTQEFKGSSPLTFWQSQVRTCQLPALVQSAMRVSSQFGSTDLIDVYNTKDKKESIFLCEEREAADSLVAEAEEEQDPTATPLVATPTGSSRSRQGSTGGGDRGPYGTVCMPTSFTGILSN
ncbi:Glycerophosphocholine phosphodiesterase GPCPD1 [Chionoecetes opilio]|uniref:Glycerophosphocholine phosphodiesterase GPCPD1 n=1 Tax=Chionoecetes opilio TaxID=41210 RepID=A0A8J4XQD1_CHIOP|nr:Glycerophosphocholine phosphodiesterase GPCPD1 [Chionoecetes opilio]